LIAAHALTRQSEGAMFAAVRSDLFDDSDEGNGLRVTLSAASARTGETAEHFPSALAPDPARVAGGTNGNGSKRRADAVSWRIFVSGVKPCRNGPVMTKRFQDQHRAAVGVSISIGTEGGTLMRNIVIGFALAVASISAANATPAQMVLNACKPDIRAFCSQVAPGGGRIKACMKAHLPELSEPCKEALFQVWLNK
jgi:Cysteine rich repeat